MLPIAKPWTFAGNAKWVPYTKTLILGNTKMLYEEIKTLPVSYWVGYHLAGKLLKGVHTSNRF